MNNYKSLLSGILFKQEGRANISFQCRQRLMRPTSSCSCTSFFKLKNFLWFVFSFLLFFFFLYFSDTEVENIAYFLSCLSEIQFQYDSKRDLQNFKKFGERKWGIREGIKQKEKKYLNQYWEGVKARPIFSTLMASLIAFLSDPKFDFLTPYYILYYTIHTIYICFHF